MEYSIEDVSPVKKKILINVTPEEVNAAIKAAIFALQSKVELDGFRKGKVPSGVIEKRFKKEIYDEAHDDLINVHLNEVIQKLNTRPASPVIMNGEDKPLVKNEPYKYEMEFEVMPDFELPPYEGLDVEQYRPIPSKSLSDKIVERIRKEKSQLVPAHGQGPATDGQIVNFDFAVTDEKGEIKGFQKDNFEMEIGAGESLPEFEELIKEIPIGHTAEKEMTFPEDFIAEDLAGKKMQVRVTVHAIKERRLPELDDKFATTLGKKDLADLYASIDNSYETGMTHLYEAEAQKKLLDKIVKQTDFPLPPGMVDMETSFLAVDQAERLAQKGKRAFANDAEKAQFLKSFKQVAEERTREKIVLLAIAKKENLEVNSKELSEAIVDGAANIGVHPEQYLQDMQENGFIFLLQENLLCDKAMDLVYERAKVQMVDKKEPEAEDNNHEEQE